MRLVRALIAVVLFSLALSAVADVFYDVPVVTQVQGAAFYRTSLALSNVGPRSVMSLIFIYRSPVDNTMQSAQQVGTVDHLGAFASDDIVQLMKNDPLMLDMWVHCGRV